MAIKINCETPKGGSVTLNEKHGVPVSYAVAGVADLPRPEIFYAWIKLPGGKRLQLFVNRETGLVCVDLTNRRETGGVELLRVNALDSPQGRAFALESLEASE